jgi:multisubunit Na+/H+ antiporter MnhG subunit
MLVFLIQATFGLPLWDDVYYLWQAILLSLCFGTILTLLPNENKWIIKPVFYYSLIKVVWEVLSLTTDIDINHPQAVNTAFLVLITGVGMLLLKDLAQRWKRH